MFNPDYDDIYSNAVKRKESVASVLKMTGVVEVVEEISITIKSDAKASKASLYNGLNSYPAPSSN